jgi:2-octaprenyl-6-methoxyphenol hydroxylase
LPLRFTRRGISVTLHLSLQPRTMHDLIIVGGGPVGAAAAAALSRSGLSTLVLEARPAAAPADERRSLALSQGSRLILERGGVWGARLPTTSIRNIHVSQRGGFGRATMSAQDVGLPALGYVVSYAALQAALAHRLEACGVPTLWGARVTQIDGGTESARVRYERAGIVDEVAGRLVVIADGGDLAQSAAKHRMHDYHQSALVANVVTDRPHDNRAFERFTSDGPIALLPFESGYALVWTTTPEHAQQLCTAAEHTFLDALQSEFGNRAGRFAQLRERGVYPLALRVARSTQAQRVLLLGNAAQTLHPVAGQGLNLGLRDAFELARALEAEPDALSGRTFVERFRSRRRLDRGGSILLTDGLVRVFSNAFPGLSWLRGCGLTALDCLPPAKRVFMGRMLFGA